MWFDARMTSGRCLALVAASALLMTTLAACGDDDSGGDAGGGTTLTVYAASSLTKTDEQIGTEFVAQHDGEEAFGVFPTQGEGVGMADAGVGDLDEHFAFFGRGHVDLDDLQGFSGFEGDGGAGFHGVVLSVNLQGVEGAVYFRYVGSRARVSSTACCDGVL